MHRTALSADDSDRIWLVETGPEPNSFVGFDPYTEEIFSQVQPENGGGSIRHMFFDEETNWNWFGAAANAIGVGKLPPRRRAVSE